MRSDAKVGSGRPAAVIGGAGRPGALALLFLFASACGGSSAPPVQGRASMKGVDPDAVQVERRAPRGRKSKEAAIPDSGSIPELDPSRLARGDAPAPEGPARNLFAFEEDPVVVAERKRQEEEARKRQEEAAKKAAEEAAKRAEELRKNPPPPQPPAIPFEFLGYFGDPRRRIGVFAPKGGGDVTLAIEGDKIFGSFHVREIGFESAEIGFDKFKETKRIPISATSGGK